MDQKDRLEQLAEAARQAYIKGFAAGSGGNVSIRHNGHIYISPSGLCLGKLGAEDLIPVDPDGRTAGDRRPSKETGMHLECYRRRPDIQCVFHLHSPYSIAVSCRRQAGPVMNLGMPAYTPGYAMRVGSIPVIPYYRPGSGELAQAVADVIRSRNTLLMANHGMVAAGNDPQTVLSIAEEIEENARLTMLLGEQGQALSARQTEELYKSGGKS